MALFRKSAEPSSSPAQLPVLYEPPVKPSAAPKAGDLEREIRREIWQHMSPDLARAAGLSLSDLLDWTTGVLRLSPLQIEAIARKIGILNTPVSGLSIIRQAMERMTRGKFPSWGAAGNRRHRKDTLGEEDGLSMQHHAAVQAFIAGDDRALTLDEINEFVAHWCMSDDAYYDPEADLLRRRDTATRLCTAYPPPAQCRPIEEIVGRNAVREGLAWAPPLYPRDPSLPPPGPARLAPPTGWA